MNLFQEKAREVFSWGKPEGTAAVDMATLLALAGLIWQLIRTFKLCKASPAQAGEVMRGPRLRHILLVRRRLKKKKLPLTLLRPLIQMGKNITDGEVESLYAADRPN